MSTCEWVVTVDKGGNSLEDYQLLHELVNIGQIMDGQVGFDSSGNTTMLGMEDEIKAYQMMYNFEAGVSKTPETATAASILAKNPEYKDLPAKGGKCAVHG